jgi:DNA-binding NtrC family response regulator
MNILLLGQETNFPPLLVEAMKQAGHGWQLPATRENAVALIQQHSFDCVVLSYSLASDMIEEFIELLNQFCPACPIIAMSEQDGMDWKLQPTMILRANLDSEVFIANLAAIEQRARLSPHQQDKAGTSKSHRRIRRSL